MTQNFENADAVAVVGMSCRFAPDLDSLDKLWAYLTDGRSTIGEMPAKRWDPYAASSPRATSILRGTTRRGSFLDDIEGFDADFFGISPREADFLDPQQRVALELTWEALAHAGIPPLSLRGSDAGVFVAANSNDYGRRLLEDIERTGAWAVNGTTYYGIANRISYFLDLRGPSMAVDTACAGSLTALHLARQSLESGEIPVAIVGGVNIMASPSLFVALDAAGATSPDGRSKAFDSAADGYGRGEGAGVVVLKRLADARRDGDPVLAVIPGSGVFQDGRSDGMMAPNGSAQEHMLRSAYLRAGIDPSTVDYVEAHGTGTPVGDRQEAKALANIFGVGRSPENPCLIGSIKPNIGHVEAGSGIAGLIKTVLALQHEEIPPSLHTEPNPEFDWEHSGLRLVARPTPWPAGDRCRRAGVSSYGVGGSIAHVIVEGAPVEQPAEPAQPEPAGSTPAVYPVSAMSEAGLRALADSTADWIVEHPEVPLTAIGHTLALRRSHLASRGAVLAESSAELVAGLRALAAGQSAPGVVEARTAPGQADGVVWVFSGHGAQWPGMGRQLLRDSAPFASVIDSLADTFRAELGWTPREVLTEGGPWTSYQVQALTFAMQVALAAVWREHGVLPDAVIGHSVGEIAAAVAAGVLELQEAATFACRRAAALRELKIQGAMSLVGLPFADAEDRLADRGDVVAAIAASPYSTVISGKQDAVEIVSRQWGEEGIAVWNVDTDIAFHSPFVELAIDAVRTAAEQLRPQAPQIKLYSTALTDPRSAAARDSAYWVTNLREPVRFAGAVEAALQDGYRLFTEISTHPVVTASINEAVDHLAVADVGVTHSIRRDSDELRTLLSNLATLHSNGADIDWSRVYPNGGLAQLPAMAWQHRPYWIFPSSQAESGTGGGHDPDRHTLLGGRMTVSGSPARQVWQTYLDMSCRPYPLDHEVVDVEITPAAVLINSFAAAAEQDGRLPGLADIVLRTPLAVTPPRIVQIVLSENTVRLATRLASDDGTASSDEENEWITHSTASIDWATELTEGTVDKAEIGARTPELWEWSRVDDMFRRMGVGGYAFAWDVEELRRNETEQLAMMTIEPAPAVHASSWAHVIDGALTISAVLVTPEYARHQWMSSHIDSVVFRGEPPARITVHSVRAAKSPDDTVDVLVADDTGQIVCQVRGLRFSAISDEYGNVAAPRDLVHELVWRRLELGQPTVDPSGLKVVLVGDRGTDQLRDQLSQAGVHCQRVEEPDGLSEVALNEVDLVLVAPTRALPGEKVEDGAERCAWTLISATQLLIDAQLAQDADSAQASPKLWILTHGVRQAVDEAALAHAPLWGAGRIVAGENPGLWGGVVDLAQLDGSVGERLLAITGQLAGQEDVISVAEDGISVARLTAIERPADAIAPQCRPSETYLITGGLGALGQLVARWLADRGARRILLAGRRALPPRSEWDSVQDARLRQQIDSVLELEALGVTVRTVALDISDAQQVATALDVATLGLPPIRGIVHAAGVTRDAMISKVDRASLHDVLTAKATGAMVLHRLFPPGSLDFFVLFSSCGQFARLTGQTTYAAANSFLDSLATHRHADAHSDTTSFGWTAWRGVGMSESISTTMLEANGRGLEAISVTEAFRAWSFGERYRSPYQAILRTLPTPAGSPRLPMFRELAVTSPATTAAGDDSFVLDWEEAAEQELRDRTVADVRAQVAAELNLAGDDVEIRRPLVELGIDSVMTVALRVRMQRRYGIDLPPNILWNKPTVQALGEHLLELLQLRYTSQLAEAAEQAEALSA